MSYPMTRSKFCIGLSCHILYLADTIIDRTCIFDYLDLCLTYSRLIFNILLISAYSTSDRLDSRSAPGSSISTSSGGATSHRLYSRSASRESTYNILSVAGSNWLARSQPQHLGPALELSRSPRPSCIRARRTPSANASVNNAQRPVAEFCVNTYGMY